MTAQEQAQASQGTGSHVSNPVPAVERSRIETTTVDGHGYGLLVCRPRGRIRLPNGSGLFRFAAQSQITEASAAHICRAEAPEAGAE